MSLRAEIAHWTDVRSRVRHYLGYRSRLLWRILYPVRAKVSFGHRGLDRQIDDFLNIKKGFYVELGAHDGYTQSNTLWLEMFRRLENPFPNF